MRIGEVRLLRFAIGKAASAHGAAEAETLDKLGVVVEFPALPQADAEKRVASSNGLDVKDWYFTKKKLEKKLEAAS